MPDYNKPLRIPSVVFTLTARFLPILFAVFLPVFLNAPAPHAQEAGQGDLLRVSNYLNGFRTLTGAFIQTGPDGNVTEGTFHLRRPGRMRFEYDSPDSPLIIADGVWIGVCDPQIDTFERFPLSGTPLSLLLRERVDLRRENGVRAVARAEGELLIEAIDVDAPDQGAITLVFSDSPLLLRRWIVLDAQGLTTTVALSDIRTNAHLGGALFRIDDEDCGA